MARLNYETHGDAANPAILLLHGFMSSNGQWLENIDALSSEYFLVTAELWGHGDSPTPEDTEYYTLAAYHRQFETIRSELGIERWAVIGQSYGAGVILTYAHAHPSICTAVVATNSRSAFGRPVEKTAAASGPAQRTTRASGPPDDLRELPYHPIHARRFPPHVKEALVEKADAMTAEAVQLGGRLGARLNCRELVVDYPLPLLITNGRFEKSFQEDIASLQATDPTLNVIDLEGGHSINVEAAAEFNAAVLEFLGDH